MNAWRRIKEIACSFLLGHNTLALALALVVTMLLVLVLCE